MSKEKNFNRIFTALVWLTVLVAVVVRPATCGRIGDAFRNICGPSKANEQKQLSLNDGDEIIERMKSEVPESDLSLLLLLKRSIEKESSEGEIARLYKKVSDYPLFAGLAVFARIQLGLVYGQSNVPLQRHYEGVIGEKIYKPCNRVSKHLNDWWASVTIERKVGLDQLAPISQEHLDWLKVETICNNLLAADGAKTAFWINDAYLVFEKSLVNSYKMQKQSPNWFSNHIDSWLRVLIPSHVDGLLSAARFLTERWRLVKSESFQDKKEPLVSGFAMFIKDELMFSADKATLSKEFEEKLVVPCRSVQQTLERWAKETRSKGGSLSTKSQDEKWYLVEEVCHNILVLADSNRDELIEEIRAKIGTKQ